MTRGCLKGLRIYAKAFETTRTRQICKIARGSAKSIQNKRHIYSRTSYSGSRMASLSYKTNVQMMLNTMHEQVDMSEPE